jgi:hypothetical protein
METNKQKALLSTVAVFPKGYFLENLAVRSDNFLLVTSVKTHELWYVPPAKLGEQVEPVLLFTFDTSPTSMVEPEPDVFYLCTTKAFHAGAGGPPNSRAARHP